MKNHYPPITSSPGRLQAPNWVVFFVVFFFAFFLKGLGQGVQISSQEPNPTQNNPVEISIEFNQRINGFGETDIDVNGGDLSNFYVEWPDFNYTDFSKRLKDFNIVVNLFGTTDFSPASEAVIAIDIDDAGYIYVLTLDEGVFKYNPNGSPSSNTPLIDPNGLNEPRDLAVDNSGHIYIANSGSNQVLKFNNNGGDVQVINSGLSSPSGLAISSNQTLYVADTENDRIVVFNNDGVFIKEINNGPGAGETQLLNPIRLAVDKLLNVYVTDAGNNRIQIYNSQGDHTGTIAGNSGKLNNPGSLVVDDYGFLYIADIAGVSLNTFLDLENISESDLIALALNVRDMRIQVFRTNNLNENPKTINSAINIPIDVALKPCGYLAVNNSDAKIEEFPVVEFIFDLKTYEILPNDFTANINIAEECIPAKVSINGTVGENALCNSITASDELSIIWDETKPEVQTCFQGDQIVEMGDEIPDYVEEGFIVFEDNCEGTLTYNQNPIPGSTISQQSTTVNITATDEAGNVSEACAFNLVVEEEPEDFPPQFENCPQSTVFIPNDPGECGAIVIIETPIASDDNGEPDVNRVDNGPASGEFFPVGVYEIIFEADDGVNDPVECRYTIRVEDNESPVLTCPDDLEFEIPAGETTVEISYPAPTISDNCADATYSRISGPASGTQQAEGTYTVVFEAEDASENKAQCSIEIVVTKEQETFEITCVVNRTIELTNNQSSVSLPTSEFIQGDTSNLEFDNPEQTFTCADIGTFDLTITARNADTGEEDSCVVEVTVVDASAPVINCYSAPIQRSFAEGESFEVPEFYAGRISDNCTAVENLQVTQTPPPGTIWDTADTYPVSFTVTDANNLSTTCSFQVELSEEAGPIFTCPDESDIDAIALDENCDFQVPDYTGLISTSNFEDTPDFDQNFERIDDEIWVEIDVFDGTEYLGPCYFTVPLVDTTAPSIECPDDIELVIPADKNSAIINYDLPTYSDNCDSSPQLELVAGFASGEVFPVGTTEVRYRVLDTSDNESFCSFFVTITRENDPDPTNTAPVAKNDAYSIPQDEILNISAANGVLANDEDEDGDALIAELRDAPAEGTLNFNPDGSFTYTPDAGFFGTDTFTYVAFDGEDFSNLASVSIVVNQVVPGNDAPLARDDEYETEQNTTLVVQAANGILQNDSDPNDDPLTTVLMNDVANGTLDLNPDGSFTYSPASGFTGTDSFTYMTNDGITNSNIATVTINVISTSSDFQCREEIVVSLGASGNVSLALEDLYTGDASGLNLSASKLDFDCSDLGENSIELSWSGQSSGNCEIKIIVEDTIPPVLEVNIISISLDEDGFAEISAEDLDAGSYDNCGDVSLSLNRTSFSCEDLGQNSVLLTATDASGNMRSTNTIVFVTASPGICRKPGEFIDETFISPNPTSGEIEIFTPENVLLERVVVFDARGRYITEEDFTNRSDYRMQLNGLQDAVYILHIFTSRRVLIKKLILRN